MRFVQRVPRTGVTIGATAARGRATSRLQPREDKRAAPSMRRHLRSEPVHGERRQARSGRLRRRWSGRGGGVCRCCCGHRNRGSPDMGQPGSQRRALPDARRPHEVARLRQGTAWCIISCTNGGEAAVTIVFDAKAGTAAAACSRLRQSLSEVAGPLEPIDDSGFSCAWQAALPRGAVAQGFVADADQQQPLSPTGSAGPRWSDAIAVTKGVVAWASSTATWNKPQPVRWRRR